MHTEEIDCSCQLLPESIELIIMALCSDYFRRLAVINGGSATYRIIMEYRFLNYRIYNAAVEIAGTRDALIFIKDIGNGRGYANSEIVGLSEIVYKNRKRNVILNIAKRLHLFE